MYHLRCLVMLRSAATKHRRLPFRGALRITCFHVIAALPTAGPAIPDSLPAAPLQRAVILTLNAVKGKDPRLLLQTQKHAYLPLADDRPRTRFLFEESG